VSYRFSKGVLTAARTFVYKKYVVLPEEYGEFKIFYENVLKEDENQIMLSKK
jgi:hypothetical protein